MMKVVAINGSARKDGNTAMLIRHVFEELSAAGIETEMIQLAGQPIQGCIACYRCFENKDRRCAAKDDIVNECLPKMAEADGIILGSPTYFAGMSSQLKAFCDRAFYVARANDDLLKRKVGAAVVAVRRGGAVPAFDSINHYFLIAQMVVPGSVYWNVGVGRNIGDVEGDEEGINTMKTLGANMAWLLGKLRDDREA
jgi:multimeric flavodoxin WrbA